jgi:hypothetical protein
MPHRIRLMILLAAAIAMPCGAAARAVPTSELEHELYRELHRGPQKPLPPPIEPPAEVLACYERLGAVAQFAPLPYQAEPAQCAANDLVRVTKVTMPDRTVVALNPAPTIRCSMAEAVVEWVRADVGPAAANELGAPLAAITNLDSYQCRGRNNIAGAKLSEHGKGNAIDVTVIKLRNGGVFNLTDPLVGKPFRERMRTAACGRFTTVLGPGSDAYHSDHIHLDLAERRGGYRICQWNVIDPASLAEVPLPPRKPAALLALQGKTR